MVLKKIQKYEVPSGLRPGYLLPTLRRELNPSEAENSSRCLLRRSSGFGCEGWTSTSLRSRFSAKGDNFFVPKKFFILLSFFFIVFLTSYFLLIATRKSLKIISPLTSFPASHFPASPKTASRGGQPPTSLIAVGDIMLGRNVNKKMHEYNDFLYPFRKVADFTSKADLTFGNLESPFFDKCPVVGSGTFTFCGDYHSIEGIKLADFNMLSLENNHALNYGKAGSEQTKQLLTQNNLDYTDAEHLTIKTVNNTTFGFLSFNLTFGLKPQVVLEKTKEQIGKVDVLIVSLHWGEEYKAKPAKWQIDLAHQLIDSGVKVILGHHSHVIGEIERYGEGVVFYSLGNFVFDQMWSRETREGLVAKINFEGKNIKDFQTYQILISDYSQPDFVDAINH